MSNNREISQLASVLKVKESSNFIGIATEGLQIIGIGTDSISLNGTNGTISATSFNGDVTGTITGTADNFTVTANNSTDETVFPVFVDGATGSQGAETDTDFNYNPNSGTLSATKFAGDGSLLTNIQGTGGGGVASTIAVSDESSDATCFPIFATSSTGNVNPKTGSNLTFNSSTGILAADSFTGTINTAAQTNITSVGTLSSLNLSGDINITSTNPKIIFTDSNGAPDYNINCEGGTLRFNDSSNNNRILINVDGHIDIPGRLDVASGIDVTGHTEIDTLNVSGISTFNSDLKLFDSDIKLFDSNTDTVGKLYVGTVGQDGIYLNALTRGRLYLASNSSNGANAGTVDIQCHASGDIDNIVGSTTRLQINGSGINVTGVSTFSGNINANGNIVGDNSTNITGINEISAATFNGSLSGTADKVAVADESSDTTCFPLFTTAATGDLLVKSDSSSLTYNSSTGILAANSFTGTINTAAQTNITSVGTLSSLVASTAKVSDLTSGRVVLAGTSGELEDSSKLTFDGTTLAIVGDATFTGNVSIAGTLTKEDVTNIDSVGLITARTGVRVTSGGLVVSSGIATFTDNIIANGNIVGDNSTNITGINQVTATTFSGALSGNATSATTATTATNVTVTANDNTDENVFLTFVDGQTGSQGIEADNNLFYNPNSNILYAGTFSGKATNIDVTANNGTNETVYPVFVDGATGSQGAETDIALSYNPSTDTLTAGAFSGQHSGNGAGLTALDASELNTGVVPAARMSGLYNIESATFTVTANNSTNETVYPVFVDGATGSQGAETDIALSYNPSTDTLTAGAFSGQHSGNGAGLTALDASELNTGVVPAARMSGLYNIESATFTVTANNSTNETVYPVFVDGATGSQGAETDTALSYNPSTDTLTAGTFSGALSGNADTATTATNVTVTDESSDSACFPVFTTAATGNQAPKTHASALYYNSTNGTLHATSFSGTLLTAAQTNITTIGTLVNLTVSGNITANGNIVGDNSTDISGIDQVTANTFSGALSGNATSATTATNVTVADESSDTTCFPLFVTAATGNLAPKSGTNLTFNSSTGALTATDFNSASDENLKENIRTIEDPLTKVSEIRGVNFDWKETQKSSMGVIAQEVEKVLPELVTDSGTKTVNYNGLIGLLIEVVKEQQTQINSLNERLSKLE